MLVRDLMSHPVVWCTRWDTAQTAASLMKAHEIGAIVVVADTSDPLLEGMITDRDLCCGVIAPGKEPHGVTVADLMSRIPVTCESGDSQEECIRLV
jgi:CBS domain-containing protein